MGRVVSAPEIVRTISETNVYRRVAINTIGLGVDGTAQRFLSTLAQANGGVYRSAEAGAAQTIRPAQPKRQATQQPQPKPDGQTFRPQRVIRRPMPPITGVRALAADAVGTRLKDNELVLGVAIDGHARAYPINMLTGPNREIINDQLAGHAIAATW